MTQKKTNGRKICDVLKEVRQKIADANHIDYTSHECHFEGECRGTCPACEQEKQYLESRLAVLASQGKKLKVAGIAAELITTCLPIAANQPVYQISQDVSHNHPEQTKPVPVIDLSEGAQETMIIRGVVMGETKDERGKKQVEPLMNARIYAKKKDMEGTPNIAAFTDFQGAFAVKVAKDVNLLVRDIGCKDWTKPVTKIKHPTNCTITLREDSKMLPGEVVIIYNADDIYRYSPPKSKKKKDNKSKKKKDKSCQK